MAQRDSVMPHKLKTHTQLQYEKHKKVYANTSNKFYQTREWKDFRKFFLSMNPLCQICKEANRIVPATDVHHVGGRTPSNGLDSSICQSLCHSCHSRITATEMQRG